jgi:hypothetical protein
MTTFRPHQPSSNGQPVPRQQRIREVYHVLVECADEREQRRIYEELKAKGLKCRVLTL